MIFNKKKQPNSADKVKQYLNDRIAQMETSGAYDYIYGALDMCLWTDLLTFDEYESYKNTAYSKMQVLTEKEKAERLARQQERVQLAAERKAERAAKAKAAKGE